MRKILSEKNLVILLFVLVLVTFSLAQEDTKKIEKMYFDTNTGATSQHQSSSGGHIDPSVTGGKIAPEQRLR